MLVMKDFSACDEAAVKTFVNELKAFNALSELQGQTIPSLHSFGQMVHTGFLAIITHRAGCNITKYKRLSLPVLETAKQGLQAMHNLHVSHGDIHSRNMLLHERGSCFVIWAKALLMLCLVLMKRTSACSMNLCKLHK